MHWKTKSKIQHLISKLPSTASYATYYWIQRKFGELKAVNPLGKLSAGIETWKFIQAQNIDPTHKVFFEIGTGRDVSVPLAYWLMGAKKIITVDLHPYVKSELIKEHLDYIINNQGEIKKIFGPLLYENRLEDLITFYKENTFSNEAFFNFCHIEYIAPCDASDLKLEDKSIDIHTSYVVFQHVPENALINIIKEGNRVIKEGGIFLHKMNYSDHFSHSDESISAINFLQYSDAEWQKYAGNKYMYMNRLRHDDFLNIFEQNGHKILLDKPNKNKDVLNLLENNEISIDKKFNLKSNDTLSITSAWIISKKLTQ